MIGVSSSGYGVLGSSTFNIGVYGQSTDGDGVRGFSSSGIGMYGKSANSHGVVGRTFGSSSFDFYAENPTAARNYGSASSGRCKRNIVNIPNAIEKISKLRGVYFNWDEEHGGEHSLGFIAEEVGEVLPEIVVYEQNGTDAVGMDYSKMTPLLVEAVNAMNKEYQIEISSLKQENNHLKARLNKIENLLLSFQRNYLE